MGGGGTHPFRCLGIKGYTLRSRRAFISLDTKEMEGITVGTHPVGTQECEGIYPFRN